MKTATGLTIRNSLRRISLTTAALTLCLGASLAWDAWAAPVHSRPVVDVAIGSSVCAGEMASPFSNSWQGLLSAHLKAFDPADTVVNLCGAANTGAMMPTGFSTPKCAINAGSTIPDPAHNITAALALHPNAIIMLGGQGDFILGGAPGAGGLCTPNTVAALEYDIRTIVKAAAAAGVPFYMSSAGPSNSFDSSRLASAAAVNRWMRSTYPTVYLNTDGVLDDGSGGLKAIYGGPGSHPNNAGHAAIFGVIQLSSLYKIR
jgi:hypothetical protein